MKVSAVDQSLPATLPEAGTIELQQTASRLAPAWLCLVGLLAVVFLVLPLMLLASSALARGDVREALAVRPFAGAQLALGLLMAGALLAHVGQRIADFATYARTVRIADGWVEITERHLRGTTTWSAPLSDFTGVARGVRASLSGSRDEIVLVHSDPARCVLLVMAPRLPQALTDEVALRLGQPVLQQSSLTYSERPWLALSTPSRTIGSAQPA